MTLVELPHYRTLAARLPPPLLELTSGIPAAGQVRPSPIASMEYRVHPEPKSLGADGHPCDRGTIGLLTRRPVQVGARTYIGKESNRLEDVLHGLVHDVREVRATYMDVQKDRWLRVVVPFLRRLPRSSLARAARRSERTVQAVRNGHSVPSADTRRALLKAAIRHAQRVVAHPNGDQELTQLADQLLRSAITQGGIE